MYISDMHCDTLTKIYDNGYELLKNNLHVDIERMRKYSGYSQMFACFISPKHGKNAKNYAASAFAYFFEEVKKNEDYIGIAKSYEEYKNLNVQNKISAFLSIEGGEAIEGEEDLDYFYGMGVRMMSLTWNYNNRLASGILGDKTRGVTKYGRSVIEKMNRLGIIADISHLNEKSFWEVCEFSEKPMVASHSNAYSVCENPRNLKDEQFKEIVRRGGFVGINLYPYFLEKDGRADISSILKNIEHFLSLGGEDVLGIGCDFDGVECLPMDINGVENLGALFEKMDKIGYSKETIDKITHKNYEKIIKLF